MHRAVGACSGKDVNQSASVFQKKALKRSEHLKFSKFYNFLLFSDCPGSQIGPLFYLREKGVF